MSRRIVLTGGGTGGHITPLLAVAHELKRQDPDCRVIYIGERNGKYASLTAGNKDIDEVHSIFAGKFRRYHGESFMMRLFAVKTNLLNLRDFFYFGIGSLQALILVRSLRPDMILLKGGFVGVPVGLAAAFWRKPFVTHDSDTMPGLANRLVSRWARFHATGMPPEYYGYPKDAMRYVGVLVGPQYSHVDHAQQKAFKTELGLPIESKVILVTGGSGGAAAINWAVRSIMPKLLAHNKNIHVIHQVGIGKGGIYDGYSHERLKIYELLNPMHLYSGASDMVITRAGANTMAELGVQAKACIVIPNPLLTGGHQTKNAAVWQEQNAAVIINEAELKHDTDKLLQAIVTLMDDKHKRHELAQNLQHMTVKDASSKLAALLLNPDGPAA